HGAGERVQSCNEVSLRAAREVQKVPNRDEENNHAPSPRCASTSNSTRRMPNASIRRVSLRGEVHVPDSGMSQQLLSVPPQQLLVPGPGRVCADDGQAGKVCCQRVEIDGTCMVEFDAHSAGSSCS